jgi:hypothetical protein
LDSQNAYKKELAKFGVTGDHLKRELVELATDLPSKFEKLAADAFEFNAPIAYYDAFRDFVGLNTGEVFLPLLRKLTRKGKDFTVYEWKHDKEPKEVQRPAFDFGKGDDQVRNCSIRKLIFGKFKDADDDEIDFGDNEIDFGDSGEIDFGDGIEIEVIGDETGNYIVILC